MLIKCVESSILGSCAHKVLIGCTLLTWGFEIPILVLIVSSFWSILFSLLFILQGPRKVIMEFSRGLSVLTILILSNCLAYLLNSSVPWILYCWTFWYTEQVNDCHSIPFLFFSCLFPLSLSISTLKWGCPLLKCADHSYLLECVSVILALLLEIRGEISALILAIP
jgi:hypothetical protein